MMDEYLVEGTRGLIQQAILNLIGRENVGSQELLRMKLKKLGFNTTQATLSRDLKELNVIKTASDGGTYKYTVLDVWKGLPVRRCEVSGNLVVFRTDTGMAPALAYKIDGLDLASILGTVAGEDTLLVVVAEGAKHGSRAMMEHFEKHRATIGFGLRATTLGHVVRGGAPTAADRILATRLGAGAVERLAAGDAGVLVGMVNNEIAGTPLGEVAGRTKPIDCALLDLARMLAQ